MLKYCKKNKHFWWFPCANGNISWEKTVYLHCWAHQILPFLRKCNTLAVWLVWLATSFLDPSRGVPPWIRRNRQFFLIDLNRNHNDFDRLDFLWFLPPWLGCPLRPLLEIFSKKKQHIGIAGLLRYCLSRGNTTLWLSGWFGSPPPSWTPPVGSPLGSAEIGNFS
jgi:hypothetical protein